MNTLRRTFAELKQYPTAILGLVIIIGLILLAVYTMVSIPYPEALRLWRGGEDVWYRNPKYAQPTWVNFFRKEKLTETQIFTSSEEEFKTVDVDSAGNSRFQFLFPIEYNYATFPQDLVMYFKAKYQEKTPHVSITWLTPDGREIRIGDFAVKTSQAFRLTQDDKLTRRLKGVTAPVGLFADPAVTEGTPVPLQGTYQLKVEGYTFEPDSDINVEFIMHGYTSGWAGTDHQRRDISVALMWGTPVALSFGLLAALGTTITTMTISAIGTWFGGWVDQLIQRITEVNLVLPFLPILIMVSTFYSRSIWIILGVTVLLSIFGGGIKTYRAIFMQVKEAPFIEAAKAYGATDGRIIFRYLVPRIIPMLIPNLVTTVPAYVFLEASLAVLGLGDPVLPTWGKVINDAYANGALYQGQYYWVLEPAVLLMVTGFAFAMVGFALDRIFNPRLRGV
jgi:peptide/nickel transport system permease protein